MRVGLIAEEVPPQIRQAVIREVRKRKGRHVTVELRHIRRIDLQIRRLLMRDADRVGRALLPAIGDLMIERRAEHAVPAMEECVHVRTAERGRARRAGAAELRSTDEAKRQVA